MFIRFSENPIEIELAGTAQELARLSGQVMIDKAIIQLEHENIAPFPYSKNLESIQIRHLFDQAVKISIEANSLLIAGSPDKLEILAQNLKPDAPKLKNYHIHIEYFEEHFYLAKDSWPIVVSFQ